MKKLLLIALAGLSLGLSACQKDQATGMKEYTVTVNTFRLSRDGMTAENVNAACFLDLRTGIAYSAPEAIANAANIDFWLDDEYNFSGNTSAQLLSMGEVGNSLNFYAEENAFLNLASFPVYNGASVGSTQRSQAEFDALSSRADIDALWTAHSPSTTSFTTIINNGQYTPSIYAFSIRNNTIRGYFQITAGQYTPNGYLTLHVKIQE